MLYKKTVCECATPMENNRQYGKYSLPTNQIISIYKARNL